MSHPVCRSEIDSLSLQQGDQHGSHDDSRHAKCDAAPTLAPDPVSVLQAWIPESLDDEVPGGRKGKEHPGNSQEEFTDGHVGEASVERSEREGFVKNDIGGQQQYEQPQSGCGPALKPVGPIGSLGTQRKSRR